MSNTLAVLIGVLLAYPLTWVEDAVRFKLRRNTPTVVDTFSDTIRAFPTVEDFQALKADWDRQGLQYKVDR